MNLIEAVKSGKPFKRKAWEDWLIKPDYEIEEYDFSPHRENIIADDWEIKEEPITRERLEKAIEKFETVVEDNGYWQHAFAEFKKELGL